jgi:hypothetical protein
MIQDAEQIAADGDALAGGPALSFVAALLFTRIDASKRFA